VARRRKLRCVERGGPKLQVPHLSFTEQLQASSGEALMDSWTSMGHRVHVPSDLQARAGRGASSGGGGSS
jgi:hypothetical protein